MTSSIESIQNTHSEMFLLSPIKNQILPYGILVEKKTFLLYISFETANLRLNEKLHAYGKNCKISADSFVSAS